MRLNAIFLRGIHDSDHKYLKTAAALTCVTYGVPYELVSLDRALDDCSDEIFRHIPITLSEILSVRDGF